MKLTWEEMREIAKRLPVGFYLGRKTPVIIEPTGGAYCDMVKGDIHIGMTLLQTAADKIDASDAEKWDREKLLRCLLYHEIGHLLLTPEWLRYVQQNGWPSSIDYGDRKDILNTFEDERLECILSQVFMGVEFKPFVRLVHKGVKIGPSSPLTSRFLQAVRLRDTTQEISDAVDDAIAKLASINCKTDSDDNDAFHTYCTELAALVKRFVTPPSEQEQEKKERQQQEQEQQKQEQSQGQSKDDGGGANDKSDGKDENENGGGGDGNGQDEKDESEDENEKDKDENEKDKDEDSGHGDDDGQDEDGDGQQPPEEGESPTPSDPSQEENGKPTGGITPRPVNLPGGFLKSAAEKLFVTPTSEVANKLAQFASRLSKKCGAQAAGCWSALHGKIETRRDAMDKDRIFRRKSDVGDKLMSSVNLTLWVDNSGSFRASGPVLNKIMAALARAVGMSGGKLAANVVKMGSDAAVAPQTEWYIEPYDINNIDFTYEVCWKQTRSKTRRNIDIVVFDGQATVFFLQKLAIANKIWNHPDCHVISDPANKPMFDPMKRAHVTYVANNYAEHLQEEVMKTLDRIL